MLLRRSELEHAIRAACQIADIPEVIIVGSQAILGTYTEDELPPVATMSAEVDVLPMVHTDEAGIEMIADRIEGVAGELSLFNQTHGFFIDGVDLGTCILPAGWRDRLVKVQNDNTTVVGGTLQAVGWCLDKEDLCASKLCANREKDLNFVRGLLVAGLVDADVIRERLDAVETADIEVIERAIAWVNAVE